jgi:hypothetical protein
MKGLAYFMYVCTVCSYICMRWFPATSQWIFSGNCNIYSLTADKVRPVRNIYDPHRWHYPPPPGYVGRKSRWDTFLYINIYSMDRTSDFLITIPHLYQSTAVTCKFVESMQQLIPYLIRNTQASKILWIIFYIFVSWVNPSLGKPPHFTGLHFNCVSPPLCKVKLRLLLFSVS